MLAGMGHAAARVWAGRPLHTRLALLTMLLLLGLGIALALLTNLASTLLAPRTVNAVIQGQGWAVHASGLAAPNSDPEIGPGQSLVSAISLAVLHQFRWLSVAGLALIAPVGGMAAYLITRLGLHPVQQLSQTASEISGSNLGTRLPVPEAKDEVRNLALTFNQMLDRLQGSFEQQDRFVTDAAHELRTPLAGLGAELETWAARFPADTPDTAMVSSLKRHTERLTQLVGDLLIVAKGEGLKVSQPVYLGPLLEEVRSDLLPVAREHRVLFAMAGDSGVSVHGDEILLHRVFFNLVENAIRYNRAGGKVTVRIERVGNEAVVSVTDTGTGIPPDALPHVFDRFYRIDQSRSRHTGGAGLGLAIVAHLVKLHGGRVTAESTFGIGSTFKVWLPLAVPQDLDS